MQGFKRRKTCGDGGYQTKQSSVKIEEIIHIDLTGHGILGDIKADPEDQCLQSARDTAGDIKADPEDQLCGLPRTHQGT